MNVFIDTNIYLTFYHFTDDDLEQLEKLSTAIEQGEILLFLPEQVDSEFRRNRESKIADALKKLSEQKTPNQFPQICVGYPEYKKLWASINEFEKSKAELILKLKSDIKAKNLSADKVITDLFERAIYVPATEEIVNKAKARFDKGDSPGKNSSYGDSINWESLLSSIPQSEDLHLIARDKDYISQIDETQLSDFLSEEWKTKKSAQVYFYTNLAQFVSKYFPKIKLISEIKKSKELAISDFTNSPSFASTHRAIEKLSKFKTFTNQELDELISAFDTNSQVSSIASDDDVQSFFNRIAIQRRNA